MDFGLFMMPLHPPRRSFADSYDRDIELIVQADRLGYHEAWIGEHITEMWENAPVPELLIAKALALTERIIFATGVTMLPLHHPVEHCPPDRYARPHGPRTLLLGHWRQVPGYRLAPLWN